MIHYRKATREDIPVIVEMIANDPIGNTRERVADPIPDSYYNAFDTIVKDKNQELIVVELDKNVIGTLQLSFIPYLTYQGGIRAQIEAVRIREDYRGKGFGQQMFEWAIKRAKERNAHVLQLTTDKKRYEAITFYKKLGFISSHEGMKLHLNKNIP